MADEGRDPEQGRPQWPPVEDDRVRLDKPAAEQHEPLDFDPYRFGQPDHPIPPEYAPPGYRPPPVSPPVAATPQWPQQGAPHQPYAYPPPNPYQSGQPPYPGAYYPNQSRSNTKATVSLVFGILALLLFWLTLWDLLLIVPAIVLGIIGRNDARREPQRGGKGAATSGLVCGILAAVLAVVATVFVYTKVKSCLDQYDDPTSNAFQTCARHKLLDD